MSAHNLNECRQVSTNTLTSLFQELNQRFMTDPSVGNIGQQLRSLEVTLQEVWTLYDSNVPEYQEKYLIFLNGKSQFLNDLIYFVHANLETENQATAKILNELKDRNQSIVLEVKEQGRLEKQALETKLKETVLSKAEIEAQYELLNEQFQALKQKKAKEDDESQLALTELKEKYQQLLEQKERDKEAYEDKIQEINRSNVKVSSEFEKEKALMEQKLQYLEKNLEEKAAKEKEYINNWQTHNKELNNELRQVCHKYELELKQTNLTLVEERERTSELEAQLSDLQQKFAEEGQAWKEAEQRYKEMLDRSEDHAKQIEQAASTIGKEALGDLENRLKEKTEKLDELQKKFTEVESKSLSLEDELKQKTQQAHKDIALKEQQLEFLEIQLKETKEQLEEANRQHQSMVEAMNAQLASEAENDMEEETGLSESPNKAERLQFRLDNLQNQLQTSQDRVHELELKIKLEQTEHERHKQEMKDKIEDLEL